MRVLLIEDSRAICEAVERGLRKSGYAVDVELDGSSGLWRAKSNVYDVIILDIMLPSIDGLAVLEQLRRMDPSPHVLVLSAKATVEDRVRGLRAGADDYLVKPFAFDELLARVQSLVRRRHLTKSPLIEIRDFVVDTNHRTVTRRGVPIELTARQYMLFEYLVLHRDRVVSRTDIETHLYDALAEPMSNVVDATIYSLRKRIDEPDQPSLIQTRRGLGYLVCT